MNESWYNIKRILINNEEIVIEWTNEQVTVALIKTTSNVHI